MSLLYALVILVSIKVISASNRSSFFIPQQTYVAQPYTHVTLRLPTFTSHINDALGVWGRTNTLISDHLIFERLRLNLTFSHSHFETAPLSFFLNISRKDLPVSWGGYLPPFSSSQYQYITQPLPPTLSAYFAQLSSVDPEFSRVYLSISGHTIFETHLVHCRGSVLQCKGLVRSISNHDPSVLFFSMKQNGLEPVCSFPNFCLNLAHSLHFIEKSKKIIVLTHAHLNDSTDNQTMIVHPINVTKATITTQETTLHPLRLNLIHNRVLQDRKTFYALFNISATNFPELANPTRYHTEYPNEYQRIQDLFNMSLNISIYYHNINDKNVTQNHIIFDRSIEVIKLGTEAKRSKMSQILSQIITLHDYTLDAYDLVNNQSSVEPFTTPIINYLSPLYYSASAPAPTIHNENGTTDTTTTHPNTFYTPTFSLIKGLNSFISSKNDTLSSIRGPSRYLRITLPLSPFDPNSGIHSDPVDVDQFFTYTIYLTFYNETTILPTLSSSHSITRSNSDQYMVDRGPMYVSIGGKDDWSTTGSNGGWQSSLIVWYEEYEQNNYASGAITLLGIRNTFNAWSSPSCFMKWIEEYCWSSVSCDEDGCSTDWECDYTHHTNTEVNIITNCDQYQCNMEITRHGFSSFTDPYLSCSGFIVYNAFINNKKYNHYDDQTYDLRDSILNHIELNSIFTQTPDASTIFADAYTPKYLSSSIPPNITASYDILSQNLTTLRNTGIESVYELKESKSFALYDSGGKLLSYREFGRLYGPIPSKPIDKLGIGLGVGLGFGIPVLIIGVLIFLIYLRSQRNTSCCRSYCCHSNDKGGCYSKKKEVTAIATAVPLKSSGSVEIASLPTYNPYNPSQINDSQQYFPPHPSHEQTSSEQNIIFCV